MPSSKQTGAPWGYANVMVPMDLDPEAESRLKVAAALADRFSSRLIGVAAQQILSPLYFETAAEGVTGIIELEERRISKEIAEAEAVFRKVVGSRNGVEWRHALAFPLDYVAAQARSTDLIVASRPRHDERAYGPMTVDGGGLVMIAGRPVLFVPPQTDNLSAKRIVVGWKDSREARRAVWDSLPLLKEAEDVFVVSVGGPDPGAKDVSAWLGSHRVGSSVLTRPQPVSSAADELVRIAEQEGADLIVCGAYGHSRAREWVFGGVTRDLLDHSPLCCLMAH